jgi:pyruvate carboxylase
MKNIRSLLVANRSEIAIRVMRAAAEMGIRTVAIYSNEDRFALHRFKADESYLVGEGKKPLAGLPRHRRHHPHRQGGQGRCDPSRLRLPVRKPRLRRACAKAGIAFIGPTPEVMRTLGNKVAARNAAVAPACR